MYLHSREQPQYEKILAVQHKHFKQVLNIALIYDQNFTYHPEFAITRKIRLEVREHQRTLQRSYDAKSAHSNFCQQHYEV